jgi:hypothetical protein
MMEGWKVNWHHRIKVTAGYRVRPAPAARRARACCTAEAGEQLGVQDPNSALQASVQVGPRIIEAAAEQ